MKNALVRRRPREFGDLLHEAWKQKKRMSPKISTEFIDTAYAEARRAGALGGKVTGAGGGGYMLFYCEFQKKHRVAEALPMVDRVVVLELGQLVAEGDPQRIWHDPKVQNAYLGVADEPEVVA